MIFLTIPFILIASLTPFAWNESTVPDDEAYFLRRIADFWEEGEYQIASSQMEKFLIKHPESIYADPLRLCMGNLLFHEKKYNEALLHYEKINNSSMQSEAFSHRLQCYYLLQEDEKLTELHEKIQKEQEPELQESATYFLALSLYRKCLQEKEGDFAQKAEPYFKTLFEKEHSIEIGKGLAHIYALLKDYTSAAFVYEKMAEKDPYHRDEMLFQKALMVAHFDQEASIELLESLNEGEYAKDAAYTRLTLLFEMKKYEQMEEEKEKTFETISEQNKQDAHLLFARTYFTLKAYEKALFHLKECLTLDPTSFDAITLLLDTSYQTGSIEELDLALSKLTELSNEDTTTTNALMQGRLFKTDLLKKSSKWKEARDELNKIFALPHFFPRAFFEKIDVEYLAGNFEDARNYGYTFIEKYPTDPLVPFAWKLILSSSQKLGNQQQFISDLQAVLEQEKHFLPHELADFSYHLAKTYYDTGKLLDALFILQTLITSNTSFSEEGNAYMLLALCIQNDDPDYFLTCAEKGLEKGGTLCNPADLSILIFNNYLDKNQPEMAADHLFLAFERKASLNAENLLWMAEFYFSSDQEKAKPIYTHLADCGNETAFFRLAQIAGSKGETLKEIEHLEKINSPQWKDQARLQLATCYLKLDDKEKAASILDLILQDEDCKLSVMKHAKLEWAKLKAKEKSDIPEIAAMLKDLVLQRELINEPLHLEAALEYIDLLDTSTEKRLFLLEKMKKDFTSDTDIIAADYLAACEKLEDKKTIFTTYLQWFDAEIFLAKSQLSLDDSIQKQLHTKAKELFLEISERSDCPLLQRRALKRI